MAFNTNMTKIIDSAAANGSHNGDKTHHQDQSIKCVSFKIMKTIGNEKLKAIAQDIETIRRDGIQTI